MFLPASHHKPTSPHIPVGQGDPAGTVTRQVNAAGTDAVLFQNRTWRRRTQ
jgi:hypothetical protein